MRHLISALALVAAMAALPREASADCKFEVDEQHWGYCSINIVLWIAQPNVHCWVEIWATGTSFAYNCWKKGESWCDAADVCDGDPSHTELGYDTGPVRMTMYHWCMCEPYEGFTSEVRIYYVEDPTTPYTTCPCLQYSGSCTDYAWRGVFYCAPV